MSDLKYNYNKTFIKERIFWILCLCLSDREKLKHSNSMWKISGSFLFVISYDPLCQEYGSFVWIHFPVISKLVWLRWYAPDIIFPTVGSFEVSGWSSDQPKSEVGWTSSSDPALSLFYLLQIMMTKRLYV